MKTKKLISQLQNKIIEYISVKSSSELLSIINTFQDNLSFNTDGFEFEFDNEDEYVSLFMDNGKLTIMNAGYINANGEDLLVSEPKFIDCLLYIVREKNKTQHIKLNDEYEAVCNEDGIKVGCQEFDWDILDKLVEVKEKIFKK